MTTQEVANRFYTLAQEGKWEELQNELFSNDAKSIEPPHAQGLTSVAGLDKIKAKGKQWESMIQEVHGGYCKEPQVAGNYFSCAMGVDITLKGQGRTAMDEIALYEVKDGKIMSEHFFY
jgi:hypothetical protein